MTGNRHGCLVHFVNSAQYAVLFAMEPEKFQVQTTKSQLLVKQMSPKHYFNVTSNENELLKTARLTSSHKHNSNPFQSSLNSSIRAFVCICWDIHTFF